MPNPKHVNDPWVRWHINLPSSLAVQVETRLLDPVTGTVGYAARAKLLEQLLREWLAKPQTQQAWVGCRECDCAFPCHEGKSRCIRLSVGTLDTSQPSA